MLCYLDSLFWDWQLDWLNNFCSIYWWDHIFLLYLADTVIFRKFFKVFNLLHFWNKPIIGQYFDTLLNSICWHLIYNLYTSVYKWNWDQFSSNSVSLVKLSRIHFFVVKKPSLHKKKWIKCNWNPFDHGNFCHWWLLWSHSTHKIKWCRNLTMDIINI